MLLYNFLFLGFCPSVTIPADNKNTCRILQSILKCTLNVEYTFLCSALTLSLPCKVSIKPVFVFFCYPDEPFCYPFCLSFCNCILLQFLSQVDYIKRVLNVSTCNQLNQLQPYSPLTFGYFNETIRHLVRRGKI